MFNLSFDPFIYAGFTAELKFDFCISVQGTWDWVGDSLKLCEDVVQMMLGPYGDSVVRVGEQRDSWWTALIRLWHCFNCLIL